MIRNVSSSPVQTQHGPCQIAAGVVAHADMSLGSSVDEVLEGLEVAGEDTLRGIRHITAHENGLVGISGRADFRPFA